MTHDHRSVSRKGDTMRRVKFIACALLVAVAIGGATTGSANPPPAGPPDTYVKDWDAVGTQAFSAAGLTPAEGHVIFAYVAIAVYDSVMAIEGGYRPFAVDVDAPEGASAQAAVAAAAHRILVHYLPVQQLTILDPAYTASLATISDGQAKTDGVAVGEDVAAQLIALRAGDGFRASVPPYTPPNPPVPGKLDPDGADAADRPLPRADGAVQPRLGRPVPAGRAACACTASVGEGVQRGEGDRFEHEHDADPRADGCRPLLGGGTGAAGTGLLPQVRRGPRARRSSGVTVHGDGLRRLRGRAHRLLRREVALRVLAADHRRPGRRHGRNAQTVGDPAWSPLLPARRTIRSTRARTRASRLGPDASSPVSWGRSRSTSRSQA